MIVWRLDRLARSLKELISYQFDESGVCNTKAEFVAEMDQHLPVQA